MKSGIVYGNAAMIDGIIDRMEEELGQPLTVLATGGVAKTIIPFCKKEIIYDDTLLFKGIAYPLSAAKKNHFPRKRSDTMTQAIRLRCKQAIEPTIVFLVLFGFNYWLFGIGELLDCNFIAAIFYAVEE